MSAVICGAEEWQDHIKHGAVYLVCLGSFCSRSDYFKSHWLFEVIEYCWLLPLIWLLGEPNSQTLLWAAAVRTAEMNFSTENYFRVATSRQCVSTCLHGPLRCTHCFSVFFLNELYSEAVDRRLSQRSVRGAWLLETGGSRPAPCRRCR